MFWPVLSLHHAPGCERCPVRSGCGSDLSGDEQWAWTRCWALRPCEHPADLSPLEHPFYSHHTVISSLLVFLSRSTSEPEILTLRGFLPSTTPSSLLLNPPVFPRSWLRRSPRKRLAKSISECDVTDWRYCTLQTLYNVIYKCSLFADILPGSWTSNTSSCFINAP